MKKPIIYLSMLLLIGSSFACGQAEKEEAKEVSVELEASVNEEEIREMEEATEELQVQSVEMQKEVSELSNEVDSILSEI